MAVATTPTHQRDEQAVQRFIERFASVLEQVGFPRMAARVFAALHTSDTGHFTAAELADLLQVSAAAISGATRLLVQINLIGREREPGTRRDRYRMLDDVWYEVIEYRIRMMTGMKSNLREGIAALGADTPAGGQLAETLEFLIFMEEEMPDMMARWHKRRDQLRAKHGG